MREQLISPDTHKLAIEKGFSYKTTKYLFGSRAGILTKEEETTPTQSLLQKWLREAHKISVLPYQADCSRKAHGCSIKWFDKVYREQICSGKNYEKK